MWKAEEIQRQEEEYRAEMAHQMEIAHQREEAKRQRVIDEAQEQMEWPWVVGLR